MKTGALTIRFIISVILASVLIVQIFSVTQLALVSAPTPDTSTTTQAGGQDSSSTVLIKEIEKVLKDLGYNLSPSGIPTSNSLPLEFGTLPRGTMQPVIPGSSGTISVLLFDNEQKAQTFSKERIGSLTTGREPILDSRKDGVVWYFLGGGVHYGPLNNKIEYSGGASGEFVCGKLTFSAEETIISDPIDMPPGGIQGPDPLRGGGENQNYKNMKAEGDRISKKASDDLAQRLQNIVGALNSRGLCIAAPPQPQPPQQVDQGCPVPNQLQNTAPSTSQDNIKPAAYASSSETKSFSKGPWAFTYKIVPGEGLVLKDVMVGDQFHFKHISVPFFSIQTAPGAQPKMIRFDENCVNISKLSDPVQDPSNNKIYRINWGYERKFNEKDLNGTLSIKYEIVIRTDTTSCEFVGQFLNTFNPVLKPECFRFIPKLSYNWQGTTPQTLASFAAYYKLDYGAVGIALDKNKDSNLDNIWYNTGRIKILTHEELLFNVAIFGGFGGEYDNIHTANPGQTVFVPGCRFTDPFVGWFGTFKKYDCNHMHWRWAKTGTFFENVPLNPAPNVDPMVDPETDKKIPEKERGTPYLAEGQRIDVAILKEKPLRYTDPFKAYTGEEIAKTKRCEIKGFKVPRSPDSCILESAHNVTVWYKATTDRKNSDTFFRHGTYVADPKQVSGPVKDFFRGFKNILRGFSLQNEPELQGYMDNAANNEYWLADGRLLSPEKGENVFAELSKAVQLIQDRKKNPAATAAAGGESIDVGSQLYNIHIYNIATSAIIFSAQSIVLNTMDAATESIRQAFLSSSPTHVLADLETRAETTPPSAAVTSDNPTTESELIKILSSNKELTLALEYYRVALNEIDLAKSAEIIDNLRLSWLHTISGMSEVFGTLGIAPPLGIASNATISNATTPTTTTTTTKPPQQQQPIINLTGIWTADDGGTYYIHQNENTVWWLGMSKGEVKDNNKEEGLTFTNVFKGTVHRSNNTIVGEWSDVPRGTIRQYGTISLGIPENILEDSGGQVTSFSRIAQTGGFGGSVWQKNTGTEQLPSPSSSSVTTTPPSLSPSPLSAPPSPLSAPPSPLSAPPSITQQQQQQPPPVQQQPPPVQQQQPPQANDVSSETESNTPIDILFDTQSDDPDSELTASILSGPSNGQLSEIDQSAGIVTYTPNPDFTGQDQFTYSVNDGTADSNAATVSITVIPEEQEEPAVTATVPTEPTSPTEPVQQPPPIKLDDNFVEYSNPILNIELKYPSNWSKGEALNIRGEDLHELWFTSLQESQSDPYLEKVTVQLLDDIPLFETESRTLEENVLSIIDALKQNLDNFELESSDDVNFQGIPAHKLVYNYTDSTIGSAKTMEIIVVRDDARYAFIFTSQSEQYPSIISTAEKIFDSIVFIE